MLSPGWRPQAGQVGGERRETAILSPRCVTLPGLPLLCMLTEMVVSSVPLTQEPSVDLRPCPHLHMP